MAERVTKSAAAEIMGVPAARFAPCPQPKGGSRELVEQRTA